MQNYCTLFTKISHNLCHGMSCKSSFRLLTYKNFFANELSIFVAVWFFLKSLIVFQIKITYKNIVFIRL